MVEVSSLGESFLEDPAVCAGLDAGTVTASGVLEVDTSCAIEQPATTQNIGENAVLLHPIKNIRTPPTDRINMVICDHVPPFALFAPINNTGRRTAISAMSEGTPRVAAV